MSDATAIGKYIAHLQQHGSSLILNWGEDTNTWEVEWITSGVRYHWTDGDLYAALWMVAERARRDARLALGEEAPTWTAHP